MTRHPIIAAVLHLLVTALVSGLVSAQAPAPSDAAPRADVAGSWSGAIEVPGVELGITIELTQQDGAWSGTCDIPMQGARGLVLGGIVVEGDSVRFALAGVPGDPTFDGTLVDGRITGTFSQAGQRLPFTLSRQAAARPPRPQVPVPPLPYRADEVTYASGEISIAGTLTVPEGAGPFPAVVLITGSGAQNRDEEIFEHRPFLVLADRLTRRGIAVLRVDDRGVGGTTGSLLTVTTEDLAGDVEAGVRFLRERDSVDAKRIGLIGHSEGGIIAPIVASRSSDVAFIVLLAGCGVPGDEILVRQLELITRAAGTPEALIIRIGTEQRQLLALVREDADLERITEQARRLVVAQSGGASEADVDAAAAQVATQLTSPWFHHFVTYDPRSALRKVRVPVLALGGELDLQVDPKQNLPAITAALDAARNPDVTAMERPGLNHLFQPATTGSPSEYFAIEITFDEATLTMIGDWILARFGPPASDGADESEAFHDEIALLRALMAMNDMGEALDGWAQGLLAYDTALDAEASPEIRSALMRSVVTVNQVLAPRTTTIPIVRDQRGVIETIPAALKKRVPFDSAPPAGLVGTLDDAIQSVTVLKEVCDDQWTLTPRNLTGTRGHMAAMADQATQVLALLRHDRELQRRGAAVPEDRAAAGRAIGARARAMITVLAPWGTDKAYVIAEAPDECARINRRAALVRRIEFRWSRENLAAIRGDSAHDPMAFARFRAWLETIRLLPGPAVDVEALWLVARELTPSMIPADATGVELLDDEALRDG